MGFYHCFINTLFRFETGLTELRALEQEIRERIHQSRMLTKIYEFIRNNHFNFMTQDFNEWLVAAVLSIGFFTYSMLTHNGNTHDLITTWDQNNRQGMISSIKHFSEETYMYLLLAMPTVKDTIMITGIQVRKLQILAQKRGEDPRKLINKVMKNDIW